MRHLGLEEISKREVVISAVLSALALAITCKFAGPRPVMASIVTNIMSIRYLTNAERDSDW